MLTGRLRERNVPASRDEAQKLREDEHKQCSDDEDWHRQSQRRHKASNTVECSSPPYRCDQSRRQADQEREERRSPDQLERARQALRNELADSIAIDQR